jgi:hypothetical protein
MIIALALPNKAHVLSTILGEGSIMMNIFPVCPANSMCATRERLECKRL